MFVVAAPFVDVVVASLKKRRFIRTLVFFASSSFGQGRRRTKSFSLFRCRPMVIRKLKQKGHDATGPWPFFRALCAIGSLVHSFPFPPLFLLLPLFRPFLCSGRQARWLFLLLCGQDIHDQRKKEERGETVASRHRLALCCRTSGIVSLSVVASRGPVHRNNGGYKGRSPILFFFSKGTRAKRRDHRNRARNFW